MAKQRIGRQAYCVDVMRIWFLSHDRKSGRRIRIQPRKTIDPRDWADIQAVDAFVGSCRRKGATCFAAANVGEVALLLRIGFIARAVRDGLISEKAWKAVKSMLRASDLYGPEPKKSDYKYLSVLNRGGTPHL